VSSMLKICRFLDHINLTIAALVKWLALCMVLLTLLIVVLRYVFAVGAIPLQESVIYMHGLLFLCGIPAGIRDNSHVRVDLVYSRLSTHQQNIINIIGHTFLLLPLSVFIFVISLPYVAASWQVLEGSAEVGGLPGVFLLKSLLPVTAVLMFLQAISELGKRCLHLVNPDQQVLNN